MKTALKQAIEKIKDYPFLYTEDSIVSILTQLLKAEKEQIMEAYHKGQYSIFEIIKSTFPKHNFEATQREYDLVESGREINEDAEGYYQQNFKSDE